MQQPSTKYLGMLLDDKLSWKSHCRYIKEVIHKDVLAMKFLRGSSWGCHPEELLRLYRAVVLPKIGYGVSFYLHSNKQHISALQKEQNFALRTILGAIKTTPIRSLHALSGLLPIEYWAPMMATRQDINLRVNSVLVRSQQDMLDVSLAATGLRRFDGLKQHINNVLNDSLINSLWLPTQDELSFRMQMDFDGLCCPRVFKNPKKDIPQEEILQKTLEDLRMKYSGWNLIYTDGSRSAEGAGMAFLCALHGGGEGRKLHDFTSSFVAEVLGVERAAVHIVSNHYQIENEKILIVTDSLSTMEALGALRKGDAPPIHLLGTAIMLQNLIRGGKTIKLYHVFSHRGLPLNDEVDRLCGEAGRSGAAVDYKAFHKDFYKALRNEAEGRWRREFGAAVGPGRWTRSLVDDPNAEPWFWGRPDLPISTIVGVTRILSLHMLNKSFLYLMRRADDNGCRCSRDVEETGLHTLLFCPLTRGAIYECIGEESGLIDEEALIQYLRDGLRQTDKLTRLYDELKSRGASI